jgi:hypothetical protein
MHRDRRPAELSPVIFRSILTDPSRLIETFARLSLGLPDGVNVRANCHVRRDPDRPQGARRVREVDMLTTPSPLGEFHASPSRAQLAAYGVVSVYALLIPCHIASHWRQFSSHPAADWAVGDWLINFSAGFVRRGLGGALLGGLETFLRAGVFWDLVLITTPIYLICLFPFLTRLRLFQPAAALGGSSDYPKVLLSLSPALMLFLVTGGSLLRKDVLPFLFVLAQVSSLAWVEASSSAVQIRSRYAIHAVLTILSGLALALLHEGLFLFVYLPLSLFLSVTFLGRQRAGRRKMALATVTLYAIPCVFAVASVVARGGAHASDTICASWEPLVQGLHCKEENVAAVQALTWTTVTGLRQVRAYLRSGMAAVYALTFLACVCIHAFAIARVFGPTAKTAYLRGTSAFFLLSLPLYFAGWDWGRWFFAVQVPVVYLTTFPTNQASMLSLLRLIPLVETFSNALEFISDRTDRFIAGHVRWAVALFMVFGIPSALMTPKSIALYSVIGQFLSTTVIFLRTLPHHI